MLVVLEVVPVVEVVEVFCEMTLVGLVTLGLIDLGLQEKVVTEREEADHCSGWILERTILKNYYSEPSRFLHCSVLEDNSDRMLIRKFP